jgi:hypothetical protein
MRPDWGHNYQMAIPVPVLPGQREPRVWVLGRLDRDFTFNDRAVATALAPLLGAITRQELWRELRLASHAWPISTSTDRESVVLHLLDDGLTAAGIVTRSATTTGSSRGA